MPAAVGQPERARMTPRAVFVAGNGKALAELADAIGEIALCAPLGLTDRTRPAVARVVAILGQLFGAAPRATRERRGRRRSHDREFALGCLVEIVGTDPDGLALSQAALVRRLFRRFEDAGKQLPSESWCKRVVSDFNVRSKIRDQDTLARWHSSGELQLAFETAEDFAAFCRTRDRLEEKWFKDKSLQQRFRTAGEFVAMTLSEPKHMKGERREGAKPEGEF